MMAIRVLCWNEIDWSELARLAFEHVICRSDVPDNIVTDRGTQCTGLFLTRVCSQLSTDHRLSTAFHTQLKEYKACPPQTMEQYLPTLSYYDLYNWVGLLPLAEFAYIHAIDAATLMTPVWANSHDHLVTECKAMMQPSSLISEIQEYRFAAGVEETN